MRMESPRGGMERRVAVYLFTFAISILLASPALGQQPIVAHVP